VLTDVNERLTEENEGLTGAHDREVREIRRYFLDELVARQDELSACERESWGHENAFNQRGTELDSLRVEISAKQADIEEISALLSEKDALIASKEALISEKQG